MSKFTVSEWKALLILEGGWPLPPDHDWSMDILNAGEKSKGRLNLLADRLVEAELSRRNARAVFRWAAGDAGYQASTGCSCSPCKLFFGDER